MNLLNNCTKREIELIEKEGIKSMEEYKKKLFLNDLDKKIQEGEEDIKNGETHKLRDVFNEL